MLRGMYDLIALLGVPSFDARRAVTFFKTRLDRERHRRAGVRPERVANLAAALEIVTLRVRFPLC